MTPNQLTFYLVMTVVITVFQVWMLIDAIRRRSPFWWNLLVFLLPVAAFVHFFRIKLPELTGRRRKGIIGAPGPALEELSELARQTPSEANKLAFADKLAELQRFPEAIGRYRDVLRTNRESKEALHGLARALLNLGRPLEAIEELATLMELEPEFRDYSAAMDYAEALWQAGKQEDTIGLLTGLVSVTKRINHRVALAHYSKERGDSITARNELDLALSEFATLPEPVRKREQLWADRARKQLAELN
ncbi:MAG TPA: tetratricopeptide repeat protein [Polyangiaceae bacterium]|nr:tetratricopeptide repeat protein [Polyangiaceae bacterium]